MSSTTVPQSRIRRAGGSLAESSYVGGSVRPYSGYGGESIRPYSGYSGSSEYRPYTGSVLSSERPYSSSMRVDDYSYNSRPYSDGYPIHTTGSVVVPGTRSGWNPVVRSEGLPSRTIEPSIFPSERTVTSSPYVGSRVSSYDDSYVNRTYSSGPRVISSDDYSINRTYGSRISSYNDSYVRSTSPLPLRTINDASYPYGSYGTSSLISPYTGYSGERSIVPYGSIRPYTSDLSTSIMPYSGRDLSPYSSWDVDRCDRWGVDVRVRHQAGGGWWAKDEWVQGAGVTRSFRN